MKLCAALRSVQSIRVDESYELALPSQDAVEGKDLDSSSVGIMANDLAGGFTELYERGVTRPRRLPQISWCSCKASSEISSSIHARAGAASANHLPNRRL